jgi:hypothetical protein
MFLSPAPRRQQKPTEKHMSTDKTGSKSSATQQQPTHRNPPPPPPPSKNEGKIVENGAVASESSPVVEIKREAPASVAAPAAPAAPASPVVIVAGQLTREQKLALFQAAFEAEKQVKAAEAAVEAAALVLSDRIKLIITALDGSQGPWNVLGERDLRARKRGEIAYFLRREESAIDI